MFFDAMRKRSNLNQESHWMAGGVCPISLSSTRSVSYIDMQLLPGTDAKPAQLPSSSDSPGSASGPGRIGDPQRGQDK